MQTSNAWVEVEAESARQYQRLEDAARRRQRGTGAELWRGIDLENARVWREQEDPQPGPHVTATRIHWPWHFLQESEAAGGRPAACAGASSPARTGAGQSPGRSAAAEGNHGSDRCVAGAHRQRSHLRVLGRKAGRGEEHSSEAVGAAAEATTATQPCRTPTAGRACSPGVLLCG